MYASLSSSDDEAETELVFDLERDPLSLAINELPVNFQIAANH